ncbi:MAG: thioredoxin [Elusimicrobia bacterium]|nr:thioredoxin [Elusimicrobiota bacterium]
MGRVKELNKENFYQEIRAGAPVLVDFWAPWCGPCRAVAPELEAVAESVTNAVIAKVNVDENPELAEEFGVRSIPNLIVFRNGQPVRQLIGFHDRGQLTQALS